MSESGYPHRFINPYARTPRHVSERLEAEFPGKYEEHLRFAPFKGGH